MSAEARLPIHVGRAEELAPRTLYGILQLRIEVFTVEQDCAYQDLDGKDLRPGALQLWQESAEGEVVATIRILEAADGEGPRGVHDRGEGDRIIGRVATAATHRGQGLAGQLIARGIELCAGHAIRISAQAHLQRWYEGFGFVRHGDEYLEDGIPHVAMRRPT